jgi:hypothetical protein
LTTSIENVGHNLFTDTLFPSSDLHNNLLVKTVIQSEQMKRNAEEFWKETGNETGYILGQGVT